MTSGRSDSLMDPRLKKEEDSLSRIPPGFKFCPTDRELLMQYLIPKIENRRLPPNRINEANVFEYNPQYLKMMFLSYGNDEEEDEEWFFFTPARDRKINWNPKRKRSEAWNGIGGDKPIVCWDKTIGFKKLLCFRGKENSKGEKSRWGMFEYRVNQACSENSQFQDILLCKIYKIAAHEKAPQTSSSNFLPLPSQLMKAELSRQLTHSMEAPAQKDIPYLAQNSQPGTITLRAPPALHICATPNSSQFPTQNPTVLMPHQNTIGNNCLGSCACNACLNNSRFYEHTDVGSYWGIDYGSGSGSGDNRMYSVNMKGNGVPHLHPGGNNHGGQKE